MFFSAIFGHLEINILLYRNRQKLLDTDRSSSGCLQTEEVQEDSKSIERCAIKAIPEPSSEEGWTAVPEVVKKKKTKKSTKQSE